MYPDDVLISVDSKYFGMVDHKKPYNPNWDITWSFTFALTGTEHGFCTFLTESDSISSGIPGHYLGYMGDVSYLTDENNNLVLTDDGDRIIIDGLSSYGFDMSGILAIAFDSTGYFALSNDSNPGIGLNSVKSDSLIIRDHSSNVIFNEALSSLDTRFFLSSSVKVPQTIRIRFNNGGKNLYVDYKDVKNNYQNLTSMVLSGYNPDNYLALYPGITFCSPLSSASTEPSTLFLSNFHTQGNIKDATYEIVQANPILIDVASQYTTLSAITAIPV